MRLDAKFPRARMSVRVGIPTAEKRTGLDVTLVGYGSRLMKFLRGERGPPMTSKCQH